MGKRSATRRWTRHFVYRTEHVRTTWKFRVALFTLVVAALWLTRGWWTVAIARSLVCDASAAPSDAILVENFEPNYLLFERATELRRAGIAGRVLVPTEINSRTQAPDDVELGTVQLLAKIAGTGAVEIVGIRSEEPVTLNAARDVRRFLEREHIRSVVVVSPLFRSRRSALVYEATLARAGIRVQCQPVEGAHAVNSWFRSSHGIQNVVEQWLKLQYYRLYVLPLRSRERAAMLKRTTSGGDVL